MSSVEEICEKYAVQNALEHGEAKIGPGHENNNGSSSRITQGCK